MSMNKETKIGLSVIVILGIIFGVVVLRRFWMGGDTPVVANTGSQHNQASDTHVHAAGKPLQQPTIVTQHANTAKVPVNTIPNAGSYEDTINVVQQEQRVEDYRGSSRRTAQSALLPSENNTQVPTVSSRHHNHQHDSRYQTNHQVPSYAKSNNTPNELNLNIGPPSVAENRNQHSTNQNSQYGQYGQNQPSSPHTQNENQNNAYRNPVRQNSKQGYDNQVTTTSGQVPLDSFRRRRIAEIDSNNQSTQQSHTQRSQNQQYQTQQSQAQQRPFRTRAQQNYQQQTQSKQANDDNLEALDRVQQSTATSRPNNGVYIVQPNDNFWKISRSVYGTGGFYKALVKHNREKHPRPSQLKVGDEVLVPQIAQLRKKYPEVCPKDRTKGIGSRVQMANHRKHFGPTRIYVVEEGDTLSDIAKYELGNVSRWDIIYRLNREKLGNDFNHLKPGTRLKIPDVRSNDDQPDHVARDNEYGPSR